MLPDHDSDDRIDDCDVGTNVGADVMGRSHCRTETEKKRRLTGMPSNVGRVSNIQDIHYHWNTGSIM